MSVPSAPLEESFLRRRGPLLVLLAVTALLWLTAFAIPWDDGPRPLKLILGVMGLLGVLLVPSFFMAPVFQLYARIAKQTESPNFVDFVRINAETGRGTPNRRGTGVARISEDGLEFFWLHEETQVVARDRIVAVHVRNGFFTSSVVIIARDPAWRATLSPVTKLVQASRNVESAQLLGMRIRELWNLDIDELKLSRMEQEVEELRTALGHETSGPAEADDASTATPADGDAPKRD